MPRKLTVLATALFTVALAATGLALADGKNKALETIMEKVQKHTNDIRKSTRTLPQWKKDAAKVAEHAAEIEKLGKEARKITTPATDIKKPVEDYEKLMDEMVKSAGDLSTLAKKKDTTQAQAKEGFNALNKSCTACHSVFRVEEEK